MADDEDFEDFEGFEETEPLRVQVTQRRGEVAVVVAGDLDAANAWRLREVVDEVLATRPPSIAIDARGLTFVDSSGLGALLSARHAVMTEAGLAFRIVDSSPALRRTAELVGSSELLGEE
jgi:anti-sigma B factor antagonist